MNFLKFIHSICPFFNLWDTVKCMIIAQLNL